MCRQDYGFYSKCIFLQNEYWFAASDKQRLLLLLLLLLFFSFTASWARVVSQYNLGPLKKKKRKKLISRQNVPTHNNLREEFGCYVLFSFLLLQRRFVLLLVRMNLKRVAWTARSDDRYAVSAELRGIKDGNYTENKIKYAFLKKMVHRTAVEWGVTQLISYMLSYMLSVAGKSERPQTQASHLKVVSLAALAVPAARHAFHHLLPLSGAAREAADGGRQRRVARLPAHGLHLRGEEGRGRRGGAGEGRKVLSQWSGATVLGWWTRQSKYRY